MSNETKTIEKAKTLKIASATIGGEQVRSIRSSLGRIKHDRKKIDGEMHDTSILDLSKFSYAFALPDDMLQSDKITVELVIEPVPGTE